VFGLRKIFAACQSLIFWRRVIKTIDPSTARSAGTGTEKNLEAAVLSDSSCRRKSRSPAPFFRRLERRQVFSVNSFFDPVVGALNIQIDSLGNSTATLEHDPTDASYFYVDGDANGIFNAGEARGLLTGLQSIHVDGGSDSTGSFFWRDNFATSPLAPMTGLVLEIQHIDQVVISSQFTADGKVSMDVDNEIRFSGNSAFLSDVDAHTSSPLGQITNDINSKLSIGGRATFTAHSIDLGNQAGDTVDFGSLNFHSTGKVNISEDSGMSLTGANTADELNLHSDGPFHLSSMSSLNVNAGGNLNASSPLTISGNITTGASMVFTAGNSALPGDNILIDNNAVIELNSAVNATLTFNAGDDIFFQSGRIVTSGGGEHSVSLFADLDHLSVGALDGDRGSIGSDGTPIIEVTAYQLTAIAAENIELDTSIDRLIARNSLSTPILIREQSGIELTELLSSLGSIQVHVVDGDATIGSVEARGSVGIHAANGSILDAQDDVLVDIISQDVIGLTSNGDISGTGIDNRLEIGSSGLVIARSENGDVFLRGLGTLTLQQVLAPRGILDVVAADSLAAFQVETESAKLVNAQGSGGWIHVVTTAGNFSFTALQGQVNVGFVQAFGDVIVQSPGNAILDAQFGNGPDITAGGVIRLSAFGSIESVSVDERIELAAGSRVLADSVTGRIALRGLGNLTLESITTSINGIDVLAEKGDIFVGEVESGFTVKLQAVSGAILDAQDDALVDITANDKVTLVAFREIDGMGLDGRLEVAAGTILEATSTAGDIKIHGLGSIKLDSVQAFDGAVDVLAAGTIEAVLVETNGADAEANDIVLVAASQNNDILVRRVAAGPNFGDVTLHAARSIVDNDTSPDDIDVSGNQVNLTADTGHIGGLVGDIFKGTPDFLEVSATGDLTANAPQGVVALFGDFGGSVSSTAKTAFLASNGDINAAAGTLNAQNIALLADYDHNDAGTLTLGPALAVIGDLRLEAADIVASDGSIDLAAHRLLFKSNQSESVSINADLADLAATGNLTVVSLKPLVELVDLDCDNVALSSRNATGNLQLTSQGSIIVSDDVIAGLDGAANSSGGIELRAVGTMADIVIHDTILSDAGNITIRADRDVLFGGPSTPTDQLDNDNRLVVTSISGNISIVADADNDNNGLGGKIEMPEAAAVIAGRDSTSDYQPGINGLPSLSPLVLGAAAFPLGQAQIQLQADGTVTLGSLQTTNNGKDAVRVTSKNGAIVDAGDSLAQPNIVASGPASLTTLQAAAGIGSLNPIELNTHAVDVVNSTNGDIRLDEVVDDLALIHAANNSAVGGIFIRASNGSLSVASDGSLPSNGLYQVETNGGPILLEAGNDIVVENHVASQSGHITLRADDDIRLFNTLQTGGNGSVEVVASNKANDASNGVAMNTSGEVVTAAGSIRIVADNESDIRLGLVKTTSGAVSLIAEGSILDNNGSLLNIQAPLARLVADGSLSNPSNQRGTIGAADLLNGNPDLNAQAIDLDVRTLAAVSARGIYLQNTGNLTIDATGPITVSEVRWDAVPSSIVDGTLADLRTTSNGPIKVVVKQGDLVVIDGDGNQAGIDAHGTGDVLLIAIGNQADLTTNTAVVTGSGSIQIEAQQSVTLRDDVRTSGNGSIYIRSQQSTVTIQDGADVDPDGVRIEHGDLLIESVGNIVVGAVITSTGSGDIGIVSSADILVNADIAAAGGRVLLHAGNDIKFAPSATITSTQIALKSDSGDVELGLLEADRIAVEASRNILDANSVATNLRGKSASLIAGGSIGRPDPLSLPRTNSEALDTELEVVAAKSSQGIYLQEAAAGGSLIVDHVDALNVGVDVTQVNFNSTQTPIERSQASTALDDLTTTQNGPIKLVVDNGNLTVKDGLDADGRGIFAGGSGDILVDLRGPGKTLTSETGIESQSGNIQIVAPIVHLQDDVATGGSGNIYVQSLEGDLTVGDGADADERGISVGAGDVLLESVGDLIIQADIASSQDGDIGLTSNNRIRLEADILTQGGDVFAVAQGRLTQLASNTIATNGGNILLQSIASSVEFDVTDAGTDIVAVNAGNGRVSIEAGTDIIDANGGTTTIIRADQLRMVAGGIIGNESTLSQPDDNPNAIDTEVIELVARSRDGIYIQEVAAGGDISVDRFDALNVGVAVTQVNFNSTSAPVPRSANHQALDDLTTTAGPIKLVASEGSITIRDGGDADRIGVSAGGASVILLDARGIGNSLTTEAAIQSAGGNIALLAQQDASIGDDVRTEGNGTVLIRAVNRNIIIDDADGDQVGLVTQSGDILLQAGFDISIAADIRSQSGDIGLDATHRLVILNSNSTGGDVLLRSGESILMSPASSIVADRVLAQAAESISLALIDADRSVALQAGIDILDSRAGFDTNIRTQQLSMESGSHIGLADSNGIASNNPRAIDLEVDKLAAISKQGIFVNEVTSGGDLTIDHVDGFSVTIEVVQPQFRSTQTDVVVTDQSQSLDDLTTEGVGPIEVVVRSGTLTVNDGNDGDGRGIDAAMNGEIRLQTQSGSGDIIINADVRSSSANGLGQGSIAILAFDDILLDATVANADSILFVAGDWIDERTDRAFIQTDGLDILAGTYAHLHRVDINTLNAQVGLQATAPGFEGQIVNSQLDGSFQLLNDVANEKGQAFLDVLGRNLTDASLNPNIFDGQSLDETRAHLRYQSRFNDGYALYIRNTKALSIEEVAGYGREPNLYIETLADDLTIEGFVRTVSQSSDEGGMVLVAAGKFKLSSDATLETVLNAGTFVRDQAINRIELDPRFFDASQGLGLDRTSTQFVLRDNLVSFLSEDFRSHVLQRIAVQYGAANEAGFLSFVGYADGLVQQFDVAGEEGIPNEKSGFDQSAISARSRTSNDVGIFTRSTSFASPFLDSNQLLPTTIIVRRADDLFVFEDGGRTDLTFVEAQIQEVRSLGARGAIPLPIDVAAPIFASPRIVVPVGIVDRPADQLNNPIELPMILDRQGEVAVYRVEFEDFNENGQAEDNELPSARQVLEQLDESSSESKASRPKTLRIKSLQPVGGGSPTAAEIDAWKAELLNDPHLPAGAYSIIETGIDQSKSVLEVFSIRDWPEDNQTHLQNLLPSPILMGEGSGVRALGIGSESEDGLTSSVSDESTIADPSPMSALWLLRLAKQNAKQREEKKETLEGLNGFFFNSQLSRKARRLRKIRYAIDRSSDRG
jgi:hypothetical protein